MGFLSPDLSAAMDRLWAWYDDYGLLTDLPSDAVLVRSNDEQRLCTPRLAELLLAGDEPVAIGFAIVEVLKEVAADSPADRRDVMTLFDAWWLRALRLNRFENQTIYSPDVVLSMLARVDAPMRRWLDQWLDELDGIGVQHLADTILEGLRGEHWKASADEAGQVLAWARSETVLNGITLIGGVHLDPEIRGLLLDRLI